MRISSTLILIPVLATTVTGDLFAAEILFDSGVRLPNISYFSDVGSSAQFIADDFQFSKSALVERVEWTGVYGGGVANDFFEVQFLVDTDPSPGGVDLSTIAVVQSNAVNRNGTGALVNGLEMYQYSLDMASSGITLNGNQLYWISIINETTNNGWAWGADNRFGQMVFTGNGQPPLNFFTSTMDFTLSGTAIPEPGAFALLSAGLICVVAWRTRRGPRVPQRSGNIGTE